MIRGGSNLFRRTRGAAILAVAIGAAFAYHVVRSRSPVGTRGIDAGGLPSVRSLSEVVPHDNAPGLRPTKAQDRADPESMQREIKAAADGLSVLRRLAETRPALAIDLALACARSDGERDHWVTELTKTWAARNPQDAWDWLGRQMPRMEQLANGSLIGVVLEEMAAQAPQRVVANVDALLREGAAPGIIPPLVASQLGLAALLKHGELAAARAAVEDWARNPRTLEVGAAAYNLVAGEIGKTSWTEASAWLETLPVSHDRNAAFAVLASKWSDETPAAALDWAESLPAEDGRFASLHAAFGEWVERDASSASDWLAGYVDRAPNEKETDRLIDNLVTSSTALKQDPELALWWTRLMQDAAQRDRLTERVVLRWARRDPAAAAEFIGRNAAITATQKLALQQKISDEQSDPLPVDD